MSKTQERTHLSADELGITEAELVALKIVRADLESGKLKQARQIVPNSGVWNSNWDKGNFAMQVVSAKAGCVRCIGGWMAQHLGEDPHMYVGGSRSDALQPLFFSRTIDMQTLGVVQAMRAIDHFLQTGTVIW